MYDLALAYDSLTSLSSVKRPVSVVRHSFARDLLVEYPILVDTCNRSAFSPIVDEHLKDNMVQEQQFSLPFTRENWLH